MMGHVCMGTLTITNVRLIWQSLVSFGQYVSIGLQSISRCDLANLNCELNLVVDNEENSTSTFK